MNAIRRTTGGKQTVLYPSEAENKPLIVVNHYSPETDKIMEALRDNGKPELNLLFVYGLDWEHDMTPWECAPLRPSEKAFTGGAGEYLELLLTQILPQARDSVRGEPAYTGIAGYSLAGLFAVYSMYCCDEFDRVASISGSMWFPGFKEYVFEHSMKKIPDRVYMSLGDREGRTKDQRLGTVRENSEAIVKHFTDIGISVAWELNPGNHFTNASLRCARGIGALNSFE
jgi:hypothetical protein